MVARTTSKVLDSRSTVPVLHSEAMVDPYFHPRRKALASTLARVLELREQGVGAAEANDGSGRLDELAFG